MEKILKRFNTSDAKPMNVLLEDHFKLSKAQDLTIENEKALMSEVSYALAVSSLMCIMICTRLDITQAMGVVSKYMSNPDKEH